MNGNTELFYLFNHNFQNPILDLILPIFTNFGSFACLLTACTICFLVARYYKNEKYFRIAKLCLLSLLLSAAIVLCLKLAIAEERPFVTLSNVRQLVTPSEPNSFPSGHASSTLSVVTVLVHEFWKNKALVIILVIFALLIAFSRVYCGVHYPIDVAVGMIVGILSGTLILKLKI